MNAARLTRLRRLEVHAKHRARRQTSQWDEMTPDEVLAQYRRMLAEPPPRPQPELDRMTLPELMAEYRRLCRGRRGGPWSL